MCWGRPSTIMRASSHNVSYLDLCVLFNTFIFTVAIKYINFPNFSLPCSGASDPQTVCCMSPLAISSHGLQGCCPPGAFMSCAHCFLFIAFPGLRTELGRYPLPEVWVTSNRDQSFREALDKLKDHEWDLLYSFSWWGELVTGISSFLLAHDRPCHTREGWGETPQNFCECDFSMIGHFFACCIPLTMF